MIERKDTASPPPKLREQHDWHREPWFKDTSDLSAYLGMHLDAALRTDGGSDDEDEQTTEDAHVFSLLRPDLIQHVLTRPDGSDFIRHRRAHAISMAIEMIVVKWCARKGVPVPEIFRP